MPRIPLRKLSYGEIQERKRADDRARYNQKKRANRKKLSKQLKYLKKSKTHKLPAQYAQDFGIAMQHLKSIQAEQY